ncbi:MAG: N-acetyltransferase GCN5 [Chloroflexota bacterium]
MPLSDVEPIAAHHLVEAFDCGVPELTEWLQRFALTSHRSDSARVYVVHRDQRVAGYYALATGAVLKEEAPGRIGRGLGAHPIPVILLARLAVDEREQGHGIGTLLLRDALIRVAGAADIIGARALLIHAQNEAARTWYLRQAEFDPSPVDPLQLMLLMKDLRRAIE